MHARAANAYKRVDLESAPKALILERLFFRFLADVASAREAIGKSDIQTKANTIDHAMRIVGELQASLDPAQAPELCANLAALYDFVTHCLIRANMTLQVAPLDEARDIMTALADAFQQAHR